MLALNKGKEPMKSSCYKQVKPPLCFNTKKNCLWPSTVNFAQVPLLEDNITPVEIPSLLSGVKIQQVLNPHAVCISEIGMSSRICCALWCAVRSFDVCQLFETEKFRSLDKIPLQCVEKKYLCSKNNKPLMGRIWEHLWQHLLHWTWRRNRISGVYLSLFLLCFISFFAAFFLKKIYLSFAFHENELYQPSVLEQTTFGIQVILN